VSKVLGLWFGFSRPVNRWVYIWSGVGLMALKYAADSLLMYFATAGKFLDPVEYLHPSLAHRWHALMGDVDPSMNQWWVYVSIAWTLPFIWIGISMSARRALNAGWSRWFGLLFFLPVANLLVILALCVAPTRPDDDPEAELADVTERAEGSVFKSALMAIMIVPLLGVSTISLSVFGAKVYGAGIFIGTPFVMGALCAYLVNRDGYRGWKVSVGTAVMSVVVCGGFFLLLALEGVVCLVTAAPICVVLAVIGALVGAAMSKASQPSTPSLSAMAIALPILILLQVGAPPAERPLQSVTTQIDIKASPEQVWPNVIGFTELPPPSDWLMKTGVAVPLRARLEGQGVGATRYCEFTTGPFVEPITVWEPPHKLGFDVTKQPPSMEEWSPYQVIHAPHLMGNMVSRRGQFELIPLPDGGTRLIGTTWYTLDMAPVRYWSAWANWVVHHIHQRVLKHIKSLSESR
jgi:hypothetical protein